MPARAPDGGRALSDQDAIATALAYQDGIAVLKVGGDIDLATVPALEAAIDEALIPKPTGLVIDLSAGRVPCLGGASGPGGDA